MAGKNLSVDKIMIDSNYLNFVFSPMVAIGLCLLMAQVLGFIFKKQQIPKIYGAVVIGLIFGQSGLQLVDLSLIKQYQEIFNAMIALVLFDVGRRLDIKWIIEQKTTAIYLALSSLVRGLMVSGLLILLNYKTSEAFLIGALLMATSPIIFSAIVNDNNAKGKMTFLGENSLAMNNLLAVIFTIITMIVIKGMESENSYFYLWHYLWQFILAIAWALLGYYLYYFLGKKLNPPARSRAGILFSIIIIIIGLCALTSALTIIALFLIGLLLRNKEKENNVFQSQFKVGVSIGYMILFLAGAITIDLKIVFSSFNLGYLFLIALLIMASRIVIMRIILQLINHINNSKRNYLSLALSSIVTYSVLLVDSGSSLNNSISIQAAELLNMIFILNILVTPMLTQWAFKKAGETEVVIIEKEKNEQ